jgi:hypothetical protein
MNDYDAVAMGVLSHLVLSVMAVAFGAKFW